MSNLDRLQRGLGYQFREAGLLQQALTHRSAGRHDNERLEFLGDSILNHVIAEALYRRFDSASEGDLSRLRASLVKGETLAEVARELDIGEYLVLGSGERKSGGQRRASILADALEAIAGAILLDGGVEACRERLLQWFAGRLVSIRTATAEKDAKTRLQEFLQGRGRPLPSYELLRVSGDAQDPEFTVSCQVRDPDHSFEGSGSSRRRAEQSAAGAALERLQSHV